MSARATSPERPFVRSPEQMRGYIAHLEKNGYEMARLDEFLTVAGEKEKLATSLKNIDPTINGSVDHLIEDIALYRQEAAAKKQWSVWEYAKSIPGRVWNTMKAHPYVSTAAVIGLGAAGAYYTGAGAFVVGRVRDWLASYMTGTAVAAATETAKDAAGVAVGAAQGAAATVQETIGGILEGAGPMATPPAAPLPTQIPSLNEAADILNGLENGG